MPAQLLKHGYKSHGESGTAWWLFPSTPDETVKGWMDLVNLCEYDGGPGREFGRRPCIRTSASYTLVTQYCGMDI